MTPAQRHALAAVSTIYAYLPQDAFLIRMPAASRDQRLAAAGVQWSGAWQPAYKVAQGLRAAATKDGAEELHQIMLQIAQGISLTDIGKSMFISVKTVSSGRARILKKLGVESNAELVKYAIRHKILHG